MFLNRASLQKVSTHFIAAMGLDRVFDRFIESEVERFCHEALRGYKREVQNERGRLLMANPLDYKAVRALDRELDDISARLHALEAARGKN
ncbi:MAG: hypothetical protein H3C49_05540 [Alphaproteobacteria bacterium]|nr:hypothetical protein [Alphaproteobacteria bacterium]HRI77421.1 hypothetical protein [Alphaproteobacteria bacterium]